MGNYAKDEERNRLIAGLRDFQSERLGIGFLAVDFLAIQTPSSDERFRSSVGGRSKENNGRREDQ